MFKAHGFILIPKDIKEYSIMKHIINITLVLIHNSLNESILFFSTPNLSRSQAHTQTNDNFVLLK